MDIAKKCIPVSESKGRKGKNVPWWNTSCEKLVQGRKKALNAVKRHPSENNVQSYKDAALEASSAILAAKQENWVEFCESCVHKNANTRDFWRKIHSIKGNLNRPIPLLKYKSALATTDTDKAQFLVTHYAKAASDSSVPPDTLACQRNFEALHRITLNDPGLDETPLNYSFSLNELNSIINTRKDSAAGLDKISYIMFKHMPISALSLWLSLYNKVWSTGVYPVAWKEACVIPLHKHGKDKNEPQSYRPISLTSHPGKLMEGIVKARLEHLLETKNIINPFQSGFRKGRSTLDQLARLQHDVNLAKNRGHSVLAVFLDLQAAFDLTWHSGVLFKLKEHGITGSCFQYLRNFLEGRKIQVKVGSSLSEIETLTRGTPQGAILSPLLFSLLINDLPETLEGTGMVTSQFADDSGTWIKGANLNLLKTRAQAGLDSIWEWAKTWGFKISQTKSVGILFGNKTQHSLDVHLGGTPILFQKVVKFLGMFLDRALSFRDHIKEIKNRCERDLNLMRMLRGTNFGSDKHSLLLLYKSLIRSKIDYGAQIYNCAKPSVLKPLDIIQNKALRLALRALNSTPVYLLEAEAGVPPLKLRREDMTVKYWARAQTRKEGNPVNGLFGTGYYIKARYSKKAHISLPFGAHAHDLVREYGLEGIKVADFRPNLCPPWTLQKPDVRLTLAGEFNKSDLPAIINTITLSHIDEHYSDHTCIYTDGSKDPISGTVASAYVIPSLMIQYSERLSNNLSIYTAEFLAIKKSLCWIRENKPKKSAILSDSLSVLTSLKNKSSRSRPDLLSEVLVLYNQCLELGIKVTLEWCPAHEGISGNELADGAAKEGLLYGSVSEDVPLAPTEVYSMSRKHLIIKWQNSVLNRDFKQTYRRTSVNLRRPIQYSLNKRIDRCITRLRMGANLLSGNRGQYILKANRDCAQCGSRYTTEHFLLHCSVHTDKRKKLKTSLSKLDLDFNIFNILNPSKAEQSSVFKALEVYILDCQMSDKI